MDAEDIELDDISRERETQVEEEGETSFTEPGDESILIIDGSNPVSTRVDEPSTSGIPNVGRDVGVIRRHIIHDKKQFLKKGLGINVNKRDGPNSTLLFDELKTTTGKNNKINGAMYKGKKILILKNGKMEYSTDKSKASLVKEFKELLKKAYNEHQKSLAAMMAEHTNIDIEEDVADEIITNVDDQINSEISDRIDNVEMSANELRELRGILNVKGNSGEAKLKALNIEIEHWEKEAAKTGGAKSKLYETIKKVGELKADQIRLNLNQKPETEVVKDMVKNETENGVLLKFKRFKRWARENIIGISAVAISVAGVITTVVIGAKNAAKKGGQSLKKFAKSVYNTGKNLVLYYLHYERFCQRY